MATKKNAVVKTGDNLPDYLKGMSGQVNADDGFGADDIAIPMIKLLQGTSEEITLHDAASPGMFWHTGMDISLGDNIQFIICGRRRKYLLQAPMDDGQGILARADDAITWDREGSWTVQVDKKTKVTWEIADTNVEKSGLAGWGTYDPDDDNSPPAATLFYDYLVIVLGHENLGAAVLSAARSQIKKCKKGINDKIQLHASNSRPMQALVFDAKPVTEQNDAGQDYFNYNFTSGGFATEENYNLAKSLEGLLGTRKIQGEGNQDEPAKRKAEGDDF